MSIGLGDQIPDECTPIRKGTILRLFDGKCRNALKSFPMPETHFNDERYRIPKARYKDHYIEKEFEYQIDVCDVDNVTKPFAKKNYVLRMKAKRFRGCPWENPPFKVLFQAQYSEATNPTFGVKSEWFTQTVDWPEGESSVHCSINTASIGDPYGHGSSGIGSAEATVYLLFDDPADVCTPPSVHISAHLNSLGMSIDGLFGTPIDQDHQIATSCYYFEHGWTPLDAWWTAAHYYAGSLGVVMNLFVRAWGIWG